MRFFMPAAFVAAVIALPFKAEAARTCNPEEPAISVVVEASPIKEMRRLRTGQVRDEQEKMGRDINLFEPVLYRAQHNWSFQVSWNSYASRSGACRYPTKITYRYTIDRTLHVPPVLRKSSCSIIRGRKMENALAKADEQAVRESLVGLEKTMAEITAENPRMAKDDLQNKLDEAGFALLDKIDQKRATLYGDLLAPKTIKRDYPPCPRAETVDYKRQHHFRLN